MRFPASFLALACAATVAAAQDPAPAWQTDWQGGLRVERTDGDFKIKFGGRLMYDWMFADADEALGEIQDGSEFRRVRFHTLGTLYHAVDFKLEFDWADGEAALKDAFIVLKDLPVGDLQIGHFFEPYSLDNLVSSKHYTFMEHAPSVNAFSPVRNSGIMLLNQAAEDRLTLDVGAFRDTDDHGKSTDEDLYAFTGRLTGLPVYADGGRRLLHLGVSGGYRHLDGTARFRARPSQHLAPYLVDTRAAVTDPHTGDTSPVDLGADEAWLYGLEAAANLDSLSLIAELNGSAVDANHGGSYRPQGWFVQASYFLTGECRPYQKRTGRYVEVNPNRNYGQGGPGAWEVAARYGTLDLNDGEVTGDELDDLTLGVNWYLNPAVRIMLNYVYADVAGEGEAHLLGARFQVAF